MAGITIWDCRERIRALDEFASQVTTYEAHSTMPDRYSRGSGDTRPLDEAGENARTAINKSMVKVGKYLKEAGCYPAFGHQDAPAAGGRVYSVDGLVNIFSLHEFNLEFQQVLDSVFRARGYYEDQTRLAWLRTINPLWWFARLVAAVIRIPFTILAWAGFSGDKAELSVLGRLYKAIAALTTYLVTLVALLSALGLLDQVKHPLGIK